MSLQPFEDMARRLANNVIADLKGQLLTLGATLLGATAPPGGTVEQPSGVVAANGIEFNEIALDATGQQQLRGLEARLGPVPAGRYWYDPMSGAAGVWGGPAAAYLGPGLSLGGPLSATASGGGNGRLTGVFVNGRELHPLDVQGLGRVVPVIPGRYWWDSAGNVGIEGGPPVFNFYAVLAQQSAGSGSGNAYYRSDASRGESTYVGGGGAAVHGRLRSDDESSSYSYYVGF